MIGEPGAFVEQDGAIMPDANDEAMAGREHTGEPVTEGKGKRSKEVKTDA